MWNIVVWTASLFRFLLKRPGLESIHSIMSFHSLNIWLLPNRAKPCCQMREPNVQWIKRWSRVSVSLWQIQQSEGLFGLQWVLQTLTGSLLRWATQKLKACLGMHPLYQPAADHCLVVSLGRRHSQVSFDEKLLLGEPSMCQVYVSSPLSPLVAGELRSVDFRFAREAFLVLAEGRIHMLEEDASATTSYTWIHVSCGPRVFRFD